MRRRKRTPEEMASWQPMAFAKAWKFYGCVGNGGRAAKEWDKLKPDADDLRTMKAAIEAQRVAYGWGQPGGQAQPYFSTFLHGGDWEITDPQPTRIARQG